MPPICQNLCLYLKHRARSGLHHLQLVPLKPESYHELHVMYASLKHIRSRKAGDRGITWFCIGIWSDGKAAHGDTPRVAREFQKELP
jgi:hypothetical protein